MMQKKATSHRATSHQPFRTSNQQPATSNLHAWGDRWIKRVAMIGAVALVIAMLATSGGCESLTPEQAEQWRSSIAAEVDAQQEVLALTTAQIDQAREQLAVMVAQLDQTPDGPQRVELAETIERTTSFIDRAAEVNDRAKTFLDDAEVALTKFDPNDPGTGISAGGAAIAGQLPAPWNLAVSLGSLVIGGLITGIYKQHQQNKLRKAAASVVNAIESVKEANGGVVDFNAKATDLKASMTPEAKELVAEVKLAS